MCRFLWGPAFHIDYDALTYILVLSHEAKLILYMAILASRPEYATVVTLSAKRNTQAGTIFPVMNEDRYLTLVA